MNRRLKDSIFMGGLVVGTVITFSILFYFSGVDEKFIEAFAESLGLMVVALIIFTIGAISDFMYYLEEKKQRKEWDEKYGRDEI